MITAKLDQTTFDDLAEKLRTAEGITLAGVGGTIQKSGATVQWTYSGGVLTLKVLHAPFGLTGVVEGKLRDALEAQGVVC